MADGGDETVTCPDCAAEVEHCHGTLIDHQDGTVDCTEPGCADADGALHVLRDGCGSLLADCGCTEPEAAALPRAS